MPFFKMEKVNEKAFLANHLWRKAQPLDITPLNPNPLFDMQ
jgi:hypothetical protein